MRNKYSKRCAVCVFALAAAYVVGLLVMSAALPLAASGADGALDFPERGEGVGHGDYCIVPDHGVYYLGRDLARQVNGWIGFAGWCEERNGRLAWSE